VLSTHVHRSSPYSVVVLCLYCSGYHRELHSFPTRRSSDLFGSLLGSPLLGSPLFGVPLGVPLALLSFSSALPHAAMRKTTTPTRSEEHTSELQSRENLVCRLLLEKKKQKTRGEEMPREPTQ